MGFFTRGDARSKGSRKAMPLETAAMLGVSAVARMNPAAKTPNMQPVGVEGGCEVLVLDGWPTQEDDAAGKHFAGTIGQRYRRRIRKVAGEDCVGYDYICRTMPPGAREPTPVEIAAFRNDVRRTIAEAKPRVIIACSHRVLDWVSPGIGYNIKVHRGRQFPVEIEGHACWVFPIIGRWNWNLCKKGDKHSSPEEYQEQTWRDIEAACRECEPPSSILPSDPVVLLARFNTRIEMRPSLRALQEFNASAGPQISVDIETRGKRPYESGAAILSIALCDGERLFAMPIQHPEALCSEALVFRIFEALLCVFADRFIVAHNVPFELEWFQHFTGRRAAGAALAWNCTEIGAFTLDTRAGKSLDYLCRMYFALPLKSISPAALWHERGALRKLLEYNALDAAAGWDVFVRQSQELVEDERGLAYDYHMDRVVALVDMQARGLPIDQSRVREFAIQYRDRVRELVEEISQTDEVARWPQAVQGEFHPMSTDDVAALFVDVLGCEAECTRDGKRTTDAEALGKLDRFPVTALILELRDVSNKLGTYIERYLPENEETYIMADGLVHCEYKSARAQTRRLACVEPNNQNWPKRKGQEIRAIVKP